MKFVEESAYAKLVKHLKERIRVFDSPLENQPDFLVFMKVTLKMLKSKSVEMYAHIINELLKSRTRYIELSYNEKLNLIYKKVGDKGLKEVSVQSNAKNVSLQIAWLHEALINELQILDHTSLDFSRYLDALNSIVTRNLAKILKQRLEQEIENQEELLYAFELYYMISSFCQIMS